MMLIGLVGCAGAGKTTIAGYLVENYGFTRLAFADPLKNMMINAGLCTWKECYVEKTPRSRELLQKIGTDIFRKQVDPLFWVNKTGVIIEDLLGGSHFSIVLDDIRFPEEAEMVRRLGGKLIMVKRDGHIDKTAGATHESECQVQMIDVDYVFVAQSGETNKLFWLMDVVMGRCTIFRLGVSGT